VTLYSNFSNRTALLLSCNSLIYQLHYYVQEPDGRISYAFNRYIIIIVIIIIIIIIILFITFMQGTYNYIPETNHVSEVYSFAVL
jgi:heme/copper-type cytochrome/quinol oxidase subunit 2